VACTLVVATLLRTVNDTVPEQAPALVFYDVQSEQIPLLHDTLQATPGLSAVQTAPLVLGRLVAVNGEALRDSADGERAREARDEHKLSDRRGNFDDVVVDRGAWWPQATAANAAGGDGRPRGRPARAADRRPAALRHPGRSRWRHAWWPSMRSAACSRACGWRASSAMACSTPTSRAMSAQPMPEAAAIGAQDRLAAVAPNIVTVRTESLLRETRALMGRASAGLAVVALVCLGASLLVLASVVAASRARQVFESSVMHALGARLGSLRRTAGVRICAAGLPSPHCLRCRWAACWPRRCCSSGSTWTRPACTGPGLLTAVLVSGVSLGLGARYLLQQMRLTPAVLLRSGG
jgi:putative ABC transport system permease protein